MKIVCECGAEKEIHCPPEFMEITGWIVGHAPGNHKPTVVRAVCVCGEERLIGPGTIPDPTSGTGIFARGKADGEWFEKHATCGTN
jgi:hypothetical protein